MHFINSKTPDVHPGAVDYIRQAADWTQYHPSVNVSGKSASRDAGMTFEHLLGVPINSIAAPDLPGVSTEVKTGRDESGSMLTLFTKNPPRAMRRLTTRFGTDVLTSERDRRSFYLTHSNKETCASPFVLLDAPDRLLIRHGDEDVAHWTTKQLAGAMAKLDRLCYAKASSKIVGGHEHFKFHSFELYHGFKAQTFYKAILSGDAYVDFRSHFCNIKNKFRDHGTAFRVNAKTFGAAFYNGYVTADLVEPALACAA